MGLLRDSETGNPTFRAQRDDPLQPDGQSAFGERLDRDVVSGCGSFRASFPEWPISRRAREVPVQETTEPADPADGLIGRHSSVIEDLADRRIVVLGDSTIDCRNSLG